MRPQFKQMFSILLLALIVGCGQHGDSTPDDVREGGGGDIGNDPTHVSGRFFFDSVLYPAVGVELVLANWNELSMRTYVIKGDGSVLLDLSEFTEGHLYSLHLISGDDKIADIDLSTNPGLQSGFVYRGGYGFNLGEVIIPKDNRGIILIPDSGIGANIGGGFNISDTSDLRLEGFPAPSESTEVEAQPSMIVSDSIDLYFGVLNPTGSLEIERVRSKYSALSLRVIAKSTDAVVRSFISRVADWYNSARLIPNEFDSSTSTLYWHETAFSLTKSGRTFSADIVTGEDVKNKLIFLRIEGQDPPQTERLRVVTTGYSAPPYLKAIGLLGAVPVTIDYTQPTTANGLTTPFCHVSGDVGLDVVSPKDLDNEFVLGNVLDTIEIRMDYYSQQSGITSPIPTDSALEAPFDTDSEASVVDNYIESWLASSKAKTFVMGTNSLALTEHRVSLHSALFPNILGGKQVSRIKLKILFKSGSHPGKSGSVLWIRKDC